MIKVTHLPSQVRDAHPLFLIPGGPGLSSHTLRPLEVLKRSFNLFYVDLPGTNGVHYDRSYSFEELSAGIAEEVMKIGRPAFVLGHSFGGFFAAKVALNAPCVSGLASLSVPFSRATLKEAGLNFENNKSTQIRTTEAAWLSNPNRESFTQWLGSYGRLYFAGNQDEGRRILEGDPASSELFEALRSEAMKMEFLLDQLSSWSGNKLFLAGGSDILLSASLLREEACRANGKFVSVDNAAHFLMQDQPEIVARLIETSFATTKVVNL